MRGKWELALNRKPRMKENELGLNDIFNDVGVKTKQFELNPNFHTIRYIDDDEFYNDVYRYVEPNFTEVEKSDDTKFILFSAPGATGKSALAKCVCNKYNGIYWELPDSKVAEYSFQGAIMEAVGSDNISNFIESLVKGESFLVIDAFDEAEAGSGRTGIEFFLRDLNKVVLGCKSVCAVLLARTESALFIKNYLQKKDMSFAHYEVGYFGENNAKVYIRNGLERHCIPVTNIVNECIEAQFSEIKRILGKEEVATSFLGYAPVLNALSVSYDDDRNTLNLLKGTGSVESNCQLLKRILDDLLDRERKKFIKALKVKIPEIAECDLDVYSANEQLLRVFGKVAYDDEVYFATIDRSIPVEYHEEYLEVVSVQLPQHPFIKAIKRHSCVAYDFTGTAFRDYVIAYCLAMDAMDAFVREYISSCKNYCPSQLLIEFYRIFSDECISGMDIPLMYSSLEAYNSLGDRVTVNINGDKDDCSIEFRIKRDNVEDIVIVFKVVDLENGIHVKQLSNCYVDVEGKVFVGSSGKEARIYNSVINCTEIIWESEHVAIEAYSPGECVLMADTMSYVTDILPRFEVKLDDKKNFKVVCNALSGYFKLIPYKVEETENAENDNFTVFANLVRRIFSCLRAHGKDTLARKMDFIDNRIISLNNCKRQILQFLLEQEVLYVDEQDWLYKLDTSKISLYSIKWHDVRDGDFTSLSNLYDKYIACIKSLK